MSISNFNLKGEQKENMNHFAGLVKLAMVDGKISKGENELLKRTAKKLHLISDQVKYILENYEDYPVTMPQGYDERIALLYDCTKMLYADSEVTDEEVNLLRRICVGLGFPVKNVDKIADKAVALIIEDTDLDDFNPKIKRTNKL